MADVPLQSNFIGDKVDPAKDTNVTLFLGLSVVSTTLARNLSDSEAETMYVVDATGADVRGYAVCESEIIYYQGRVNKDQIRALLRGQQGTGSVTHLAGTVITLHPFYYIPKSFQDAIINLQTRLIALGG